MSDRPSSMFAKPGSRAAAAGGGVVAVLASVLTPLVMHFESRTDEVRSEMVKLRESVNDMKTKVAVMQAGLTAADKRDAEYKAVVAEALTEIKEQMKDNRRRR